MYFNLEDKEFVDWIKSLLLKAMFFLYVAICIFWDVGCFLSAFLSGDGIFIGCLLGLGSIFLQVSFLYFFMAGSDLW